MLLQGADSPRSDPHQPLTFFCLNTHVWTVSRDIRMEKWTGRVEVVVLEVSGEAEQDWGVLQQEVMRACAPREKSTWRELCIGWAVGGFPCQEYLGSLPDTKHRTALKPAAISLSLSLVL